MMLWNQELEIFAVNGHFLPSPVCKCRPRFPEFVTALNETLDWIAANG